MKTHKIGRNDLCPCNSGKKNKRCCQLQTRIEFSSNDISNEKILKAYKESLELDSLSNSVTTLIKQGQTGKALEVCQQLLERYPDVADGLHRYSEVYEAMGDNRKAIEYLKMTKEFMNSREGHDSEWVTKEIRRIENAEPGSEADGCYRDRACL